MSEPWEHVGDNPENLAFTPKTLDRSVIAMPLLEILQREKQVEEDSSRNAAPYTPPLISIIIDLNLEYRGGRDQAKERLKNLLDKAIPLAGDKPEGQGINTAKSHRQYVFARLQPETIRTLVRLDRNDRPATGDTEPELDGPAANSRAIYRIWPDFKINGLTVKSVITVKADAARVSFSAFGDGIVWAVLDSGIDKNHPHFLTHNNLRLEPPLRHRDYTGTGSALEDGFGHGTHVAGIIAGEMTSGNGGKVHAVSRCRDENGDITHEKLVFDAISGMAPRCRLLSFKVLDEAGQGEVSSLIAAIDEIQRINGYGRRIRIHGVNLSVGYDFEPEWFACGQSPLCVEVDLLARSGVVVVVAAGNTGYGYNQAKFTGPQAAGMDVTINDPGNAEHAITVGSTHREMPHVYGVSYFSSKGPTGDGRMKPDLVAPGEKILSCAAGKAASIGRAKDPDCNYVEDSGTSMAAPHVSGVIAAFLSVRREFIGKPEAVKEIFLASATDLKRERRFQGAGLVDLMRAIQSV